MNKKLLVNGLILTIIFLGLSGCTETNNNIPNIDEPYINLEFWYCGECGLPQKVKPEIMDIIKEEEPYKSAIEFTYIDIYATQTNEDQYNTIRKRPDIDGSYCFLILSNDTAETVFKFTMDTTIGETKTALDEFIKE